MPKIFREMGERAHYRIRREPAKGAERAKSHRVTKIRENLDIGSAILVADDAVDDLDTAGRADPAGRALAARFEGAEFQGEARLLRHVDGIVEDDHAAMADQALGLDE